MNFDGAVKSRVVVSCIILITLLIAVCGVDAYRGARYAWEDMRFAMHPSAKLAMIIADTHFSSRQGDMYDVNRAEYYFERAAQLDAGVPNVFHQLARVSFLRGNFDTALLRINTQISLHGDSLPASYYMRGLIEGYMGQYAAAAEDYSYYLKFDPTNWAAMNDYAWVLLKDNRPIEALSVTSAGLRLFPDNPWLLNSHAVSLYETADFSTALEYSQKAFEAASLLTKKDWLLAYPGNDPRIASDGIQSFQRAVEDNIHRVESKSVADTVQ